MEAIPHVYDFLHPMQETNRGPVMNTTSLESRIRDAATSLSKAHRRLAEYILDPQNAAGLLTAAELARAVGTSEATVVRFAKSLGYSGYPELRRLLQASLRSEVTTVSRFASTLDSAPSDSMLSAYLTQDVEALLQTGGIIDDEQFDAAVTLLVNARRVHVVGHLMAFPSAHLLRSGLSMIGIDAFVLGGAGTDSVIDLHNCDERDVLVSISLRRYNQSTLRAIELASEVGMSSIAITDDILSPTATRSQLALIVATTRTEFFQSTTSVTSLVNALVTACSVARPELSRTKLAELEAHWGRARTFYSD
ncbi:MurR/RpiR family transcriptional regulator [Nocardia grenadensis]|uniref:MurR/RpiR family transcriptional regulator n=1 Tax=Nocardia grenadensis TaxID=931537 RepID=UPI003D94B90C